MTTLDDQITALTNDMTALQSDLAATEAAARTYSANIIAQLTALRTQFSAANPALQAVLDQFTPLHDQLAKDLADIHAADPGPQPASPA